MSLLERHAGSADEASSRNGRRLHGIFATLPIAIVGSLAVTLSLVTPAHAVEPRQDSPRPKERAPRTGSTTSAIPAVAPVSTATTAVADAPTGYRVQSGDTVSSIAGRFGLSTASVLAVNGLSWKSLIFPGQVLALPGRAAAAVPVSAPPAPAAPAPAPSPTGYVVRSGDTISGIARRFGVATNAVLAANGLGGASVIFPGQRITIPGVTTAAAVTARPVPAAAPTAPVAPAPITPPPAGALVALTDEMRANAAVIVQVGRQAGVGDQGLVIALAAAAQESGLRNVRHGDRDSLGLFQQRPSTGWGTPDQILDPRFAARAFFGGAGNPNAGRTRGLLDIPGWRSMSVAQAAQAVQISAYPDAYAKWEPSARAWLAQLG